MTLTYGFYDSSSSDRVYNAKQFGSIFDGIIEDGVYAGIGDKFMVVEDSPVSMDVIVGTGRAWFNHTWTLSDATIAKTLATADALLDRIDVVYLEVNEDSGTRANKIDVLTGTPASTPVAPTLTQTASIHQYPLAHVYVAAAVTSITQAEITNKVGTTETPFVAGIIDYVTTNEIVAQWEAEWDQWFQDIIDQLSTEAETNLQNQIWDLAGVASGAPPYADDMVTLAAHDHSNGNHPKIDTGGLEDYAVTSIKIAPDAVTNLHLAANSVGESEIASNSVGSDELQNLSVGTNELKNGAVTNVKLATASVANANLQDYNITPVKMQGRHRWEFVPAYAMHPDHNPTGNITAVYDPDWGFCWNFASSTNPSTDFLMGMINVPQDIEFSASAETDFYLLFRPGQIGATGSTATMRIGLNQGTYDNGFGVVYWTTNSDVTTPSQTPGSPNLATLNLGTYNLTTDEETGALAFRITRNGGSLNQFNVMGLWMRYDADS